LRALFILPCFVKTYPPNNENTSDYLDLQQQTQPQGKRRKSEDVKVKLGLSPGIITLFIPILVPLIITPASSNNPTPEHQSTKIVIHACKAMLQNQIQALRPD
jgi:hypothetical protein